MFRVVQGEEERVRRARDLHDGDRHHQDREPAAREAPRRTFVSVESEQEEEGPALTGRESIRRRRGSRSRQRAETEDRDDYGSDASPSNASGSPPRTCRICLGEEVEENSGLGGGGDELFSPCLCRGTSAFVHRSCLNDWRRLSTNPNSHFRCDSCRYTYRTVQVRQLGVLTTPALLASATTAIVLAVSVAVGFLHGRLPDPFRATRPLYRLLRLSHRWRVLGGRDSPLLDDLFVGVFAVGIAGFAGIMVLRYRRFRGEELARVVAPSLAISTLNLGTVILRIFALVGLLTAWAAVYGRAFQRARKFVMTHGEVVLDVGDSQAQRRGGEAAVRTTGMGPLQTWLISFAFWLDRFAGIEGERRRRREGGRGREPIPFVPNRNA